MPRVHKRKLGSRSYMNYSVDVLTEAIENVQNNNLSIRQAAARYNIPRRTLCNKIKQKHDKTAGGQTALSAEEEKIILNHILTCADWGMPLDSLEIRLIVKDYLLSMGKRIDKFTDNLPGESWYSAFIKRHKEELTVRKCQNITRVRAKVGVEQIVEYFSHLERSLHGIPALNVLNYDETNFSDDPGTKKMVFRRGVKYPERILNSSKGCISIMFAITADGNLLPCYVVYRAEHLWKTWVEGGPPGTRYGRTKTGWFDGPNYEDWFFRIVVPWAQKLEGRKCIIGDNLSSHISVSVLRKCEELDIQFIFLPPNATHLCQPLDVAFFSPLKKEWRKILTEYKIKNPSSSSLEKSMFPRLLKKLIGSANLNHKQTIVSGFKTCGIVPLDRSQVLKKIPGHHLEEQADVNIAPVISETLLNYLQECRRGGDTKAVSRQKKLNVPPGQSVSAADVELPSTTPEESPSTSKQPESNRRSCISDSETEDEDAVSLHDSTSDDLEDFGSVKLKPKAEQILVDSYVIVEFPLENQEKKTCYLGKITKIYSDHQYEVSCLRTKDFKVFVFPAEPDISDVDHFQIFAVLPDPITTRRGRIQFGLEIKKYFKN